MELKGRAKWLKKTVDKDDQDKRELKRQAKRQQEAVPKGGKVKTFEMAPKKVVSEEELITEEALDKKLAELMATRGRKVSDKRAVVQQLEYLCRAAKKIGPRKEIPLLMHLIAAIFDSHRNIDDYIDIKKWATCHRSLTRIIDLLSKHNELSLGVATLNDLAEQVQAVQLNADFIKTDGEADERQAEDPNVIKVVGSLEAFLLRLEVEYRKSLQQINPHTHVSRPFLLHATPCAIIAYYIARLREMS